MADERQTKEKPTALPKPEWTQVPNVLLDTIMADMGEAELKVTLAIIRQIIGYHKERPEAVSYSQLEGMTGLSRQGVINGLRAALDRGIVRNAGSGPNRVNLFTLNFKDDAPDSSTPPASDQSTKLTTRKSAEESTGLTSGSQRNRPQVVNEVDTPKKDSKEKESKKEEQTPPPPVLVLGITAGDLEGVCSAGGGGGGETDKAGEDASDSENQSTVAALPEDCKQFVASLRGSLADQVRALQPETQLAWWYEVKTGNNPAGLLATRLKSGAYPLPGNLRRAQSTLAGKSTSDSPGERPSLTDHHSLEDWEAAGWDPRVLMGLPDTSKAGV